MELPTPREVQISSATIVFDDALELYLGDVTCQIHHIGGDHASDSCVMFIPEERVLFLGDCWYDAIYTPVRHYTRQRLLSLLEKLRTFEADHVIEGHSDVVMDRAEFNGLLDKFDHALALVDQHGADAAHQINLDEDTDYFVRALIAGHNLST